MGANSNRAFIRPDIVIRVAEISGRAMGLEHSWVLGSKLVEATWSDGAEVAESTDVTVVLCGQFHSPGFASDAEAVLRLYVDSGLAAVTSVDGSFVLVVIDRRANSVWICTDRFNTRKAYTGTIDSAQWVATSLRLLPIGSLQLDPTGICSYLASDGTHDRLTPYAGVEMMAQASVHSVEPTGILSNRYWELPFAPRNTGTAEALAGEMVGLMRAAIRNKVMALDPRHVFLSASGGYDSKGLLGLLVEALGTQRVTGITYYNNEQVGDMDLPHAQRAAQLVGVAHRSAAGYNGDLVSLLRLNADLGEGVAHFCDDALVWRTLRPELVKDVGFLVVAGDRQWRWPAAPRPTPRAALSFCSVKPPEVLDWLYPRLPSATATAMREGWGDRFEKIEADLGRSESWPQTVMRAYHEQRLPHTLMLWRERFSGESARVSLPYLDRALMEFVGHLPVDLNNVELGLLHQRAIKTAFPSLFTDGVAKGGWNMPSWSDEIPRHSAALAEIVLGEPSRLDDLIPPDIVLDLIAEVATSGRSAFESTEGWAWFVRKQVQRTPILRHAVRRTKLRRRLKGPVPVGKPRLLRSLLTLRMALTHDSTLPNLASRTNQ